MPHDSGGMNESANALKSDLIEYTFQRNTYLVINISSQIFRCYRSFKILFYLFHQKLLKFSRIEINSTTTMYIIMLANFFMSWDSGTHWHF